MPTKISEVEIGDWYFKALFTGEPAVRKTTAACSWPGQVFLMDIDKKGHAMALPNSLGLINSSMEYEPYDSWFRIQEKLIQLQANCPYDMVIFDSVTECGDVINRGTKTAKGNTKKIAGIPVNTIEDYNAESNALIEAVNLGLSLPCHFIMIAHVIKRDIEKMARTIVTGGKTVAAKMPTRFPEVFHFRAVESMMEGGDSEYEVVTQHTGLDFARTTLPLPSKFDWTNKSFYETMSSHLGDVKLKGEIESETTDILVNS